VAGKTDVHKIENRNSGLVLDDVGGQKDAPAPVKQYESWNDDGRQQWQLISVPAPPAPVPTLAGVLKYGDKVHLQNGYANWQGGYLDTYGNEPAPKRYGVFTTNSQDRAGQGTGSWRVCAAGSSPPDSKVREGTLVHLLNGYANWQGGYLDTYGNEPAPKRYGVFTTNSQDRAGQGTGTWKFSKA
jgi:hypothetical protein